MKPLSTDQKVQTFGFLLVPNFALMSYASATEPLRAANLFAGRELYAVRQLSLGGKSVRSSGGIEIDCEDLASAGVEFHTVFVCAGGGPENWVHSDKLFGSLRRLSRLGVRLGAISSGAYVLAAAGLLSNRDFTIHWEHAPMLREAYPDLVPRQTRYVIDGNRITCGGGIAPLDMMHGLITERMGGHFASRVSDWYLQTAVAASSDPQRASAAERFGTNNPILLAALEKMEATIEDPLDREAMAQFLAISGRHLDRLFVQHLSDGFSQTYRRIRLNHARRLIEQSPLTIAEVALATGFCSTAHFSQVFKAYYGRPPSSVRSTHAHR
ncbi:helix-turn-helix domain-containing protein [Agrobacterium vitis]|uniref:Helix-turn-helix domain-containing protein n=1 Tax=Agrobacterium vitis TaxID=373 RepID=A0A6L6VJQ1_AGRVI|nr:GlxA family transcriptional regulator [Agrobacterium vitis]MUZ74499.1 helix-turn-helix domain-containing protein [Agrobacterium vitis]